MATSGDPPDRSVLLQFTEQLDNRRVDLATFFGCHMGSAATIAGMIQDRRQILGSLDGLNPQAALLATFRSGDRDDRFIRALEQAVANVN